MIDRLRIPTFETLPKDLPVFPLFGAMLLPGGHMPLNVFEPRYLNMIEDALKGSRLIGMIQPITERDEHLLPDGTKLYEIGCAGRITQFGETEDGRYLIVLDGLIRFRVEEELGAVDGYRRVRPDFSPYIHDFDIDDTINDEQIDDRDRLLSAMTRYFDLNGITADTDEITESSDQDLITTLAMSCPLDPGEKQALLECATTFQRGELLTNMLEIAAYASVSLSSDVRQ